MRLLRFILTVIGFITVLKYGLVTLLGMTNDPEDDVYIKVYPSPNGKYSAAHISRSGGGAIAPFCSDAVVVFNSLLDVSDAVKNADYQVCSAECDSFFDHQLSPKLQWDSDNDLQVDFAIGGTRMLSRNVDLRGSDASGKIQVKFSAYR